MVGTETEEGHDELVEEILRRLEEHDLYVKPEKCEWKVREVGFLGVVIGPDGIKMEKEKVRGARMANPKMCKRCPEVFRTSKLLQEVCEGLCGNCKANAQVGMKAGKMELGK